VIIGPLTIYRLFLLCGLLLMVATLRLVKCLVPVTKAGERIDLAAGVDNEQRQGNFVQVQLMNQAVPGLASSAHTDCAWPASVRSSFPRSSRPRPFSVPSRDVEAASRQSPETETACTASS
jgi:hypothetical protein